ncbi:MAG: ribosome maturation factor RimP [Acidobacteria bacterium]|nr:ribosome maturation factor RimP [Acidobacteriota bacterium]
MVEEDRLELVHVEYRSNITPPVLRIYIDKPGGVNHQDCQRVSNQIGELLDEEDVIASSYILEVSSPGIERPLFKEEDYQRFVGQEIQLVTTEKIDDQKKFKGFIQAFSQGILDLEVEGATRHIPVEKIRRANLVHRF